MESAGLRRTQYTIRRHPRTFRTAQGMSQHILRPQGNVAGGPEHSAALDILSADILVHSLQSRECLRVWRMTSRTQKGLPRQFPK